MDKRDMTVNEVKLILQIEDPRAKEQRQMGIEDKSGISRDEIALAFTVREPEVEPAPLGDTNGVCT